MTLDELRRDFFKVTSKDSSEHDAFMKWLCEIFGDTSEAGTGGYFDRFARIALRNDPQHPGKLIEFGLTLAAFHFWREWQKVARA